LGQKADWLPYFAPMAVFAAAMAAASYAPGYDFAFLGLRVALPLLLFLYFLSRGCYPELKGFTPGSGGVVADVLFGLLVAGVWVAPYLLWLSLRPDPSEAFNPNVNGAGFRTAILALRFAGFAAVTPFIEELLVRSYLMRMVDVYSSDRDFREIPVGTFAWPSFLVTVAWFTLSHARWEWPVAFLAGVLYNLWLYRRKHIASLVLAHAVTNAALFFLVVWGAASDSAPLVLRDLWFFL
jgi:CAAX prenyl protease-like protein